MSTPGQPDRGATLRQSRRSAFALRLSALTSGPVRLRNYLRQAGMARTLRRLQYRAQGLKRHRDYPGWVRRYDSPSPADLDSLYASGSRGPMFAEFTVHVGGVSPDGAALERTLASLRSQTYRAWSTTDTRDPEDAGLPARPSTELSADSSPCRGVTSPSSPNGPDVPLLFAVLVEAGDVLAPWALHVAAAEIAQDPSLELLYADCDQLDARGRRFKPWFKPSFNRELLLEQDYTTGLRLIRRSLLDKLHDGPGMGLSRLSHGSVLRLTELTKAHRIRHIPHVLVHRGESSVDTPMARLNEDAVEIQDHLDRTGRIGVVQVVEGATPRLRVFRTQEVDLPGVTVIVPTRDAPDLLRVCIDGLIACTDYGDLRVLIADNGSTDPAALELLRRYGTLNAVDVVPLPGPFNYSAINNAAAGLVETPLLLLLNNDIEIIHDDWLTQMVGIAMDDGVGAVGAKLLYPDDTVQHAGVVLGIRPRPGIPGVAGHTLKHAKRHDSGYFQCLVHTREVSAVTGACLLTHTALFAQLGGLDSRNLPVAFNDVDYCLRVRTAGLRVVWTPLAELYHHESVSRGYDESGEGAARFEAESAWMRQRWGELLDDDPMYNPNLSIDRSDMTLAYPPRALRPWVFAALQPSRRDTQRD